MLPMFSLLHTVCYSRLNQHFSAGPDIQHSDLHGQTVAWLAIAQLVLNPLVVQREQFPKPARVDPSLAIALQYTQSTDVWFGQHSATAVDLNLLQCFILPWLANQHIWLLVQRQIRPVTLRNEALIRLYHSFDSFCCWLSLTKKYVVGGGGGEKKKFFFFFFFGFF